MEQSLTEVIHLFISSEEVYQYKVNEEKYYKIDLFDNFRTQLGPFNSREEAQAMLNSYNLKNIDGRIYKYYKSIKKYEKDISHHWDDYTCHLYGEPITNVESISIIDYFIDIPSEYQLIKSGQQLLSLTDITEFTIEQVLDKFRDGLITENTLTQWLIDQISKSTKQVTINLYKTYLENINSVRNSIGKNNENINFDGLFTPFNRNVYLKELDSNEIIRVSPIKDSTNYDTTANDSFEFEIQDNFSKWKIHEYNNSKITIFKINPGDPINANKTEFTFEEPLSVIPFGMFMQSTTKLETDDGIKIKSYLSKDSSEIDFMNIHFNRLPTNEYSITPTSSITDNSLVKIDIENATVNVKNWEDVPSKNLYNLDSEESTLTEHIIKIQSHDKKYAIIFKIQVSENQHQLLETLEPNIAGLYVEYTYNSSYIEIKYDNVVYYYYDKNNGIDFSQISEKIEDDPLIYVKRLVDEYNNYKITTYIRNKKVGDYHFDEELLQILKSAKSAESAESRLTLSNPPTHKYYVRLNSDPTEEPFYLFSSMPNGDPIDNLTLNKETEYVFERTDSDHPFNIGDAWQSNNTGITVVSTGSDNPVNGVNSIVAGETLTFTIPNHVNSLKYYCYLHTTMINDFTLANRKYQIKLESIGPKLDVEEYPYSTTELKADNPDPSYSEPNIKNYTDLSASGNSSELIEFIHTHDIYDHNHIGGKLISFYNIKIESNDSDRLFKTENKIFINNNQIYNRYIKPISIPTLTRYHYTKDKLEEGSWTIDNSADIRQNPLEMNLIQINKSGERLATIKNEIIDMSEDRYLFDLNAIGLGTIDNMENVTINFENNLYTINTVRGVVTNHTLDNFLEVYHDHIEFNNDNKSFKLFTLDNQPHNDLTIPVYARNVEYKPAPNTDSYGEMYLHLDHRFSGLPPTPEPVFGKKTVRLTPKNTGDNFKTGILSERTLYLSRYGLIETHTDTENTIRKWGGVDYSVNTDKMVLFRENMILWANEYPFIEPYPNNPHLEFKPETNSSGDGGLSTKNPKYLQYKILKISPQIIQIKVPIGSDEYWSSHWSVDNIIKDDMPDYLVVTLENTLRLDFTNNNLLFNANLDDDNKPVPYQHPDIIAEDETGTRTKVDVELEIYGSIDGDRSSPNFTQVIFQCKLKLAKDDNLNLNDLTLDDNLNLNDLTLDDNQYHPLIMGNYKLIEMFPDISNLPTDIDTNPSDHEWKMVKAKNDNDTYSDDTYSVRLLKRNNSPEDSFYVNFKKRTDINNSDINFPPRDPYGDIPYSVFVNNAGYVTTNESEYWWQPVISDNMLLLYQDDLPRSSTWKVKVIEELNEDEQFVQLQLKNTLEETSPHYYHSVDTIEFKNINMQLFSNGSDMFVQKTYQAITGA